MKYIFIYLSILLFSCTALQKDKKENIDQELEKLDSAAGTFSSNYFNDAAHAHRAFKIAYDGTKFSIVPGSATLRPGNPPFSANDKSGPYLVAFKDGNGRIAFSYSLDHPGVIRACEGEKPEVHQKDIFTFEVLAPAKIQVVSIAITNKGKSIFESRVPYGRPRGDSVRVN